MNEQLLALAIQHAPEAIAALQRLWADAHPGTDVPGSEEVIAAYGEAFASSLAKDAAWLAAHPE